MTQDGRDGTAAELAYGIRPPGYRLPDATRLGRVVLQVSDLAASLAYYEPVIGLRVLHRDERSATLGAHGSDEPLVELRERRGAVPMPRHGRLGLYHFAILLPDRASLGRFVGHLRRLGVPAGMSDHAVSEAVYLSDPDGLGIEVYADRPRSAWRHSGRELHMVTEPLDVPEVVRAAGAEEWAGAPAGTVIGHVHLFVRDLDEAARFYHEGMGFDRVVWSYPGALFLSAGGYHHHLGTNTWASQAAPAGEEDARLLEWTVLVPEAGDVADVARSLEGARHVVERSDGALVAADPWGTRVRVTTR
ncbi:MAG TPA: VOC family protein [Gemmatimonadales bacterium]